MDAGRKKSSVKMCSLYTSEICSVIHIVVEFYNSQSALFPRLSLSTYEATLDGGPDDMTVVDATTLRRQVGSFFSALTPNCGARTTCDWESVSHLSIAHQVEPASPTFGGGEQGASKARGDPVLGRCCFLARQHLGVVATLEPLFLPSACQENALFFILRVKY